MCDLFEYVGKYKRLKNAVVTINKVTEKSYYINFRPEGGAAVEIRRVSKKNLKPYPNLTGIDG